jgi:hypothetical protein
MSALTASTSGSVPTASPALSPTCAGGIWNGWPRHDQGRDPGLGRADRHRSRSAQDPPPWWAEDDHRAGRRRTLGATADAHRQHHGQGDRPGLPLAPPAGGGRQYGSVIELVEAEKINKSNISRMLRLSFLAPDIVEAILDRRQPPTLGLPMLLEPLPIPGEHQQRRLMATRQVGKPSA